MWVQKLRRLMGKAPKIRIPTARSIKHGILSNLKIDNLQTYNKKYDLCTEDTTKYQNLYYLLLGEFLYPNIIKRTIIFYNSR